ncbi:uncharacterized protein LOC125863687 [Solanum stenotomum]|uniref:uncharacterized protein LOC125863687 n=1 Tax=Solanum stenotomum TaxID=172797 RepID=UPI0020D0E336|nr:uncharacterized protein LOC125863687 [Solanum stenotomum]
MGPQRRLGIYVGYESRSIIKYLEARTGDLFTTRFADCHFDESVYLTLGGEQKQLGNEIDWNSLSLSHLDPRTNQCELEVQKIIYLQNIANQLPDAFTNLPRVTKSYIPATNTQVRVDVPIGQNVKANESGPRLKRGRPIGSKDKNPQKRKGINDQDNHNMEATAHEELRDIINDDTKEEVHVPENNENEEISINYVSTRKMWNRNNIVVDNIFAYNVAVEIMQQDGDLEPRSVNECKQRNDWPKWKEAIQTELASLEKREVFGPIVRTPEGVKPVGYLINMTVHKKLEMHLMDVVTAYLYGSLDHNIFMKIPEALKVPEAYENSKESCSIKLQKSLFGLKQSGRMWYNRLSEYLLKEGYKNDPICPCIFIRRSKSEFVIISVYVDDLNIIGTPTELSKAVECLKKRI